MNFILKIAPAFLKKLDGYLRANHTWIWATRIHLNLYLSVLLSLLFILLGFLYKMDVKDVISTSEQNFFFGILFIPATILLGFFIYNMSIYNPDKSAGYRFRYQEFFVFIIFFITLSLPLLIPYPTSWVLNERVANIKDVKALEKQAVSFELGSYYYPSNRHNFAYFPNDSAFLSRLHNEKSIHGQTADVYEKIRLENDSWRKLNDSIFDHKGVFINTRPHLYYRNYVGGYYSYYQGNYSGHPQPNLENFNLEKNNVFKAKKEQLILHRNNGLAKDYINKFAELLFIYSDLSELNTEQIFSDYSQHIYFPSYVHKYLKHPIHVAASNMHQIRSAQIKDVISWNLDMYKGLSLAIFCICLVFQVFKSTHWSQLLRSILFIGLLYTLVLVIDAATSFKSGFILIFTMYSSVIIAIISLRGFDLKRFSTLFVQFNIYLSFISPFFFLILLAYLENVHQFFFWSWFDGYKEINQLGLLDYGDAHYAMIKQWYYSALWIGIFSYIFIWNSYLKSLYLRYWSLPKNN